MHTEHVTRCIEQGIRDRRFSDVAVAVRYGTHRMEVMGENTDRFTYFDVASCGKVLVTSPLIWKALGEKKICAQTRLSDFFLRERKSKKRNHHTPASHTYIRHYPLPYPGANRKTRTGGSCKAHFGATSRLCPRNTGMLLLQRDDFIGIHCRNAL